MTMANYPVELTPDDNGTVMVSFPDVPEALTFGEDEADALARAQDALETALSIYVTDRRDVPAASPARGRPVVSPTLRGALKLAAYAAMRGRGWRKADLARELKLNPRQIDRLLDLRHGSTITQLEQALRACGKMAVVEARDLAA